VRTRDLGRGEERLPFIGDVVPEIFDPADLFSVRRALEFCTLVLDYRCPPVGTDSADSHWRDLAAVIRQALAAGEIAVIAVEPDPRQSGGGAPPADNADDGKSDTTQAVTKSHWIEFQVIDIITGKPVPAVQLEVILADASKQKCKTDGSGSIRFDDTTPGDCTLLSDWKDVRLEDAYAFVAVE
jgi:hypothetical protein